MKWALLIFTAIALVAAALTCGPTQAGEHDFYEQDSIAITDIGNDTTYSERTAEQPRTAEIVGNVAGFVADQNDEYRLNWTRSTPAKPRPECRLKCPC